MRLRLKTREMKQDTIHPLSSAEKGSIYEIIEVDSGEALKARLRAMGIRPGAIVKAVRISSGGPVVLGLDDSRMVLGRGMVEKVFARKVEA